LRRHAAVYCLLQQDLLDVVGREPALGEGRAHVQAELVPGAERHQGADDQDAARAFVEMRPGPHFAPGAPVMNSWNSLLNAVLPTLARSTAAEPNTCRRRAIPRL